MKPGQVGREVQGLFKGQRGWRDGAPHGAARRKDREEEGNGHSEFVGSKGSR